MHPTARGRSPLTRSSPSTAACAQRSQRRWSRTTSGRISPRKRATNLPRSRLRVSLGVEELLPRHLIIADGGLTFGRDQPISEFLRERELGLCVQLRIELDDVIAIEQPRIAFEQDRQMRTVLKAQ